MNTGDKEQYIVIGQIAGQAFADPISALHALMCEWDAAYPNKNFPYHRGQFVHFVRRAFVHWLRRTGGGLLRFDGDWYIYRTDWTCWARASKKTVAQHFQEFWATLSDVVCSSRRITELLNTMATMPVMAPRNAEILRASYAGDLKFFPPNEATRTPTYADIAPAEETV